MGVKCSTHGEMINGYKCPLEKFKIDQEEDGIFPNGCQRNECEDQVQVKIKRLVFVIMAMNHRVV